MKIVINNTFSLESSGYSTPHANSHLKKLFDKIFSSSKQLKPRWLNDKEVVLQEESSSQLNRFLLKAEELGKKIEYSRQTVIKITD